MAIIGQTQSLTIPAVGTAGTTYATQINAALEAIEAVLETKVTPSSITVNQTFNMANNAIENVTYIELPDYADTSPINTIYVSGGELHYRDEDGSPVQITAGGSLALAAAGGIGGNYTDVGSVAAAWYRAASTDYYFLSDTGTSPETYAGLVAGTLTVTSEIAAGYPITAAGTTITRSTGGSSYNLTLPNAAPAGKRLIQVDGSGVVTYENNVDGGFTVNDSGLTVTAGGITVDLGGLTVTAGNLAVSSGTITSSGALTVSSGGASITGTCAVTGAITSTSDITATGVLRWNGTRYKFISAVAGHNATAFVAPGAAGKPAMNISGNVATTNPFVIHLPVEDGEVISHIKIFYENMGATNTLYSGVRSPTTTEQSTAGIAAGAGSTEHAHAVSIAAGSSSYTVGYTPSLYLRLGSSDDFYIYGIGIVFTAG